MKQQPVPGYDHEQYVAEREWATADDGTAVPISIVHRRDTPIDGTAPLHVYGYGSYEASIDPTFDVEVLPLLDRGWVYTIAHPRGGGELGREWYEDGKLANKMHTFTDFIACADDLVAKRYGDGAHVVARGASAGGLLMGAITNLRPDRWRGVVAEVPFVDVLSTMSDASIPLTVNEWEEWGNPAIADEYRTMRTYSPYDNLAAGVRYPKLLVTGGLNDHARPVLGAGEIRRQVARDLARHRRALEDGDGRRPRRAERSLRPHARRSVRAHLDTRCRPRGRLTHTIRQR